jgi:hypothetical protein
MVALNLVSKLTAVLCVLIATFTLSACVERVVETRPAPAPAQTVVYVQKQPPQEIVEVQPQPPGPGERWAWQKGHWRWDGRDYHWFPGRWVERPVYAREWAPPRWEARGGNGYVFIEGSWR